MTFWVYLIKFKYKWFRISKAKNSIDQEIAKSINSNENNTSLHSLIKKEADIDKGIINFKISTKPEQSKDQIDEVEAPTSKLSNTNLNTNRSTINAGRYSIDAIQKMFILNKSFDSPDEIIRKNKEAEEFVKKLNKGK